jgi:hypothetical protein
VGIALRSSRCTLTVPQDTILGDDISLTTDIIHRIPAAIEIYYSYTLCRLPPTPLSAIFRRVSTGSCKEGTRTTRTQRIQPSSYPGLRGVPLFGRLDDSARSTMLIIVLLVMLSCFLCNEMLPQLQPNIQAINVAEHANRSRPI